MIAVLILGTSGGAFATNLLLLMVCVALGAIVSPLATRIHQLRGWRKVGATVAMNIAAAVLVLAVAQPHLLIKAAASMECVCYWGWESWCCYFEAFQKTLETTITAL